MPHFLVDHFCLINIHPFNIIFRNFSNLQFLNFEVIVQFTFLFEEYLKLLSKGLDFKVESLYEESKRDVKTSKVEGEIPLTTVKGIGKGSAENLNAQGVMSIADLLEVNPDTLSAKISGASSKTILEWQTNAKTLVHT